MQSENLVACAWQDIKRVHFLSNVDTNLAIDKAVTSRSGEGGYRTVEKPVIAEHYNSKIGVRWTVWIKCWGRINTHTSVSSGTIHSTIGFGRLLWSIVLFFTRRSTPLRKYNPKKVYGGSNQWAFEDMEPSTAQNWASLKYA